MRYVISAYAIVLGALAFYWLRVQAARRALGRAAEAPGPGARP